MNELSPDVGQPIAEPLYVGQRLAPSTPKMPTASDAVIVFALVEREGKVQLDLYSGLNGLHIRTIPAERFHNPIYVSGGAEQVVVIDRFGDRDLIRVTDEYGGAGANAFDENGFPLDTVDWRNVTDRLTIHSFDQILGLNVSSLGEAIFSTSDYLLYADLAILSGVITDAGQLAYAKSRRVSLPAYGTPAGSPTFITSRLSEPARWAAVAMSEGCVVVLDLLQRKTVGVLGLPDDWTPLSVAHSSKVLSVGLQQGSARKIVRVLFAEQSGFLVGPWKQALPEAGDYDVGETFAPSAGDLKHYLRRTAAINLLSDDTDYSDLPAEWTASTSYGSQEEANKGRTPVTGSYQTSFYATHGAEHLGIVTVPAQTIDFTGNYVAGNSTGDVVAEAYAETNFQLPMFLLLHNTHYDWMTSGGFTYGCNGDITTAITNGGTPIAIGTMRKVKVGVLKPLPDLKVALIDETTNEWLYRVPKPRGYRTYGGTYASLRLVSGASTTACTTEQDEAAEDEDGIARPGKTNQLSYPPAFEDSELDLDEPFELYKRSVVPNGEPIVVGIEQKSWSMRDEDGALNVAWALPSAGIATKMNDVINYPPVSGTRNVGVWNLANTAGFYWLDLPYSATTRRRQLEEEYITASAERKAEIDAELLANDPALDLTTYAVPTALRNRVYQPADLDVETPVAPVSGSDGSLVRINDKRVGAILRPGIRTWLGVEVRLSRWTQYEDGVENWAHPETRENGLGVPVADYVTGITEGFRLTGSQVYESGWTASEGAIGTWEVDILVNGVRINNSENLVTFPEQITERAPSDAISALYDTYTAGTDEQLPEIYHRGKVFAFDEEVDTVEVRARLVNTAYNVFRIGYRTVRRIDGANFWFPVTGGTLGTCWGTDPGFYGGTTCESLGCGNVSCASFLFHDNKLYASDPIYKWTRQVLWEGSARYTMVNNPYEGYAVGRVMNVYFDFDLNCPMRRYLIDLRDGKGPVVG